MTPDEKQARAVLKAYGDPRAIAVANKNQVGESKMSRIRISTMHEGGCQIVARDEKHGDRIQALCLTGGVTKTERWWWGSLRSPYAMTFPMPEAV